MYKLPDKEEAAFISTPATTVLARLLPDATTLRLEAWSVDDITAQITLRVYLIQNPGAPARSRGTSTA